LAEQVTVLLATNVTGGPSTSVSHSFQLTAYDRVSITIPGVDKPVPNRPVSDPANASVPALAVEVQPSSDTDRVTVLAITSDRYSADLMYSVTDGDTEGAKHVALDTGQLLVGGAVALLRAAPRSLSFRNGMGAGNDANVTIFAGRKATED